MKKFLQILLALTLAACGQNTSSKNNSVDSTQNQTQSITDSFLIKDSGIKTKPADTKVVNVRDIDTGETTPRKTGSISDASGSTGANNIKAERDSLHKKSKSNQ